MEDAGLPGRSAWASLTFRSATSRQFSAITGDAFGRSCSFQAAVTQLTVRHDGSCVRWLSLIDEFSRACLAIDVAWRLTCEQVLERLSDLFVRRDVPRDVRRDNGIEFQSVRESLNRVIERVDE